MDRDRGSRVEVDRFAVTAPDGVSLAVWVCGEGPPIVLVHGSFRDHHTFDALVAALAPSMTTYAMDRRGFGASTDSAQYGMGREFDDVAAVVDAVAARAGRPVVLWGHSFGASCAMGAAARTGNVSHLVLYEPSLGIPYPTGSIHRVEEAVERGDVEAAVIAIFTDILDLSAPDVEAMRSSPSWPALLAAGPTVPRECRVEDGWVYEPGQFAGVTAPALLLLGSDSPQVVKDATARAAEAIPGARVHVLDGHDHFAHKSDPAMVAELVLGFAGRVT